MSGAGAEVRLRGARWCDADAAPPQREVCMKLMSQQMCTIIPQSDGGGDERGSRAVGAGGGPQVRPPIICSPAGLPGPEPTDQTPPRMDYSGVACLANLFKQEVKSSDGVQLRFKNTFFSFFFFPNM